MKRLCVVAVLIACAFPHNRRADVRAAEPTSGTEVSEGIAKMA